MIDIQQKIKNRYDFLCRLKKEKKSIELEYSKLCKEELETKQKFKVLFENYDNIIDEFKNKYLILYNFYILYILMKIGVLTLYNFGVSFLNFNQKIYKLID